MYITANGARLFVDVEGAGLVPDGPRMHQKPTLVLLHGGPGMDHSFFKPAFSALADVAQIVYLDHRGNGRSERGSPSDWNLAQWGDDVRALCDAMGILKPIVYGVSFGGFVAQSYATRHPDHPGKLVLTSTAAHIDWPVMFDAFARIGGSEAAELARQRWLHPTAESRRMYRERCFPMYTVRPQDNSHALERTVAFDPVNQHFARNEFQLMDFRPQLSAIRCPTLVLAGDCDPMTPLAFSETIVECLPSHLVRFERFVYCGHGIVHDQPERHFQVLRDFISA